MRQLRVTLAADGPDAPPRAEGLIAAVARIRRTARCSARGVLRAMLSRYGYTLLVAFTSAMLTFPFGFFRSSPQVRAGGRLARSSRPPTPAARPETAHPCHNNNRT